MPPNPHKDAQRWTPPTTFEEYQVLWPLGRGGMGEVFLGHDTVLDRPVAIKFIERLADDPQARERYLVEARAAARLQHPNVAAVYRVGVLDSHPYIISEYVPGQNLEKLPKPLPWQFALEIAVGLARGLAAAHRRGVLHRDIKPANAILSDTGEVKLVDFGLAKQVESAEPVKPPLDPWLSGDAIAPTMQVSGPAKDPGRAIERQLRETAPPGGLPTPDSLTSSGPTIAINPAALRLPPRPTGSERRADTRTDTRADARADTSGERRVKSSSSGERRPVRPSRPARPISVPEGAAGTRSLLMGTPLYMAPERLSGAPATRRADIYSLGVLLFELCAGVPPFYDVPLEQLERVVPQRDAPPLLHLAPLTDSRFAALIDRCLKRRPGDRFASGVELLESLERLVARTNAHHVPDGNPYRGPLPFLAEHRSLFFGRKSEVGTVMERLRGCPSLLVTGESGVGKTSFCRAGVLPLIGEGVLDSSRPWRCVLVELGPEPLRALVEPLASALGKSEDEITEGLRRDPQKLGRLLGRVVSAGQGVVLFVDKLEELLLPSQGAAAQDHVRVVAEALSSASAMSAAAEGLRVLFCARSDSLGALAQIPALAQLPGLTSIDAQLEEVPEYLLQPLQPEKLREAILAPAALRGVRFEPPELVEQLVAAFAPPRTCLPLLQLCLSELWDAHQGEVISQVAYNGLGGIGGILSRHANHVFGAMPPPLREAAQELLLGLLDGDGAPLLCREAELCPDLIPARRQAALDALVRGHLIILREGADGPQIELTHEALAREWPAIKRWRLLRAVARPARSRPSAGESSSVKPLPLPLRRPLMVWLVPLLLSLAVALVGGFYGIYRYLAAREARQVSSIYATKAGRELEEGLQKAARLEELQLLSLRAIGQQRSDEAAQLWASAHAAATEAERAMSRASHAYESALQIDPDHGPLREALADVLYERAVVAERDRQDRLLEELLHRLRLYDPRGERMRRFSQPGRLVLRSVPPGAHVTAFRYTLEDARRPGVQAAAPMMAEQRLLGATPLVGVELPAGAYLLSVVTAGRPPQQQPALVAHDRELVVNVDFAQPERGL
ncbi:MAG: protein kinase [Polyangia bacterium]